MLGENKKSLLANVVAVMANNEDLAGIDIGDGLVRVWVAKNDGGTDVSHVLAEGVRGVVNCKAALRVAAEHNLGVGARCTS